MKHNDKYTTTEKKTEDNKKPEDKRTETNKILLSNDAFAISEMIESLIDKIEHARRSMIR